MPGASPACSRGWRDDGGTGASAQAALATRVSSLLTDGRLAAGTRVPSERELAAALGIGRGTVAAAYEQLREDGYLRAPPRLGHLDRPPERDTGRLGRRRPGGVRRGHAHPAPGTRRSRRWGR